ncbi:MAG: hypothetical protein F6K28_56600, partial [Microcoleus sp. SIO2G3]|nr:hypothetical protein [Microcoleus sp. SIO2G3]
PDTFAADDYDTDPSPDLQELDLSNHPSYQDRNGANNRRRRRRVGKEPFGRGLPRPDETEEAESAVDEPIRTEPIPAPTIAPARENRHDRNERVDRGERPDRQRANNRRERPPAEPPQVIAIEMTPEEQDVYAMMGVSPLVLSAETVKDPKSAVITVTLPGESGAIRNGAVGSPPAVVPEVAEAESQPEPSEAIAQPLQAQEPEPEVQEESAVTRRRRRRRSSAEIENGAEMGEG